MFKTLLAPSVRLMRNLPLARKFTFVSLAFLVPLAFLLSTVWTDRTAAYEFNAKETLGSDTIAVFDPVTLPSGDFRAASIGALSKQEGAPERLPVAAAQVDKALAQFDTHLKETGDPLNLRTEFTKLQQVWAATKGKQVSDVEAAFENATTWVVAQRAFIEYIASSSNLALDPDADSYALMVAYTSELPRLMDAVGRVRSVGSYLARGQISDEPEMFMSLHNADALTDEYHQRSQTALNSARVANPGSVAKLNMDTLVALEQKVISRIDQDFVWGAAPKAKGDEWFETVGVQVKALATLHANTGHSLNALLEARSQKLNRERWTALVVAVLFVAVGMYLLAGFYAAASSTFGALGRRIGQLGQGDFTIPTKLDGRDELARAGNRMRDAMTELGAMVRQVRASAQEISAATTEIATGNDDLARRGSEMAAIVEQTSASTAALEEAVSVNLHNAREANDLVQGASLIAGKGGAVVEKAVSSMNEITTSSHKIGDIIQVIDTIAFQTNILALNAAVEAARAGEQGRGFAVVAGEVRALAQRSAGAAREIKALITTSIETVTSGNEYVGQAGTTMQEMVRAIERITTLMSDITSQSNAQAEQIRQMAAAIREVDSATQQNAALVEETAATANNLSDRAAALARLAEQFKTD